MKQLSVLAEFALALQAVAFAAPNLGQFVLHPSSDNPLDPFGDERRALNRSGILDDVFGGKDLDWKYYAKVAWAKATVEYPGVILDPSHLKEEPRINLTLPLPKLAPCDPEEQFVLAVTDPDAPSQDNPKNGEFCHYLAEYACRAANVLTSVLDLEYIKDIKSYKPPAPPAGTGTHRYVVVVFTPDDDDANDGGGKRDFTKPESRKHWGYGEKGKGLRKWAKENDMKPVAATYFVAMHQGGDN